MLLCSLARAFAAHKSISNIILYLNHFMGEHMVKHVNLKNFSTPFEMPMSMHVHFALLMMLLQCIYKRK